MKIIVMTTEIEGGISPDFQVDGEEEEVAGVIGVMVMTIDMLSLGPGNPYNIKKVV